MALGLILFGQSDYELCYRVTNDGDGGTLNLDAAGGATPDLVTDSLAESPVGKLVRQVVANETAALRMMCDLNLAGDSDIAPPLAIVGNVSLQPEQGQVIWGVRVLDDGAGHLRLTIEGGVNGDATPTAILKIKCRHSIDR